jgi:hypothetical protein
MRIVLKIAVSVLSMMMLTGCDDDEHADQLGGGPGSSDPNNIVAGDGFCAPQGGTQAMGEASFDSGITTAKIDTDGDPMMQGHDPDWRAGTSGHVNGQPVNSATYAYVVMSADQMRNDGVSLGDWATVTNTATGATTFARVEDKGPPGGTGEISEAAAKAVGIQFLPSSATVGNPSVTVQAFGGTASIEGDCPPSVASSS